MFKFLKKQKKIYDSLDSQPKGYPPEDPGVRAISAEEVRAQQKNLEMNLKLALGLGDELYDELVSPVIDNLARIVHLLPASQNHHHNGIGGLFRHSLEVAYHTVQGTEGVVMVSFFDGTPKSRRDREVRWRVTAAFAGMAHDLGKVQTDLRVTDENGERWQPIAMPLYDWLQENDLDRYFIQFQPGRKGRHEGLTKDVAAHLWTDRYKMWLLEEGDEIITILNGVLAGSAIHQDSQLAQLLRRADQRSVEQDLKAQPSAQASPFGVTLSRRLVDGMRRLVQQKSWRVNQPGGRVWVCREGSEIFTYVVWHQGAKELSDLLVRDKIPGVPRHEATLADVLFESELAIPYEGPTGESRLWPITSKYTPGATLYTLKFQATVLFPDVEPACINIQIVDPHAQTQPEDDVVEDTPAEEQESASAPVDQHDGDGEDEIPHMPEEEEGDSHAALVEAALVKRAQEDQSENAQPKEEEASAAPAEQNTAMHASEAESPPAESAPHVVQKPSEKPPTNTRKGEPKQKSGKGKTKSAPPESKQPPTNGQGNASEAEKWLKDNGDKQGRASQWLIDLAKGDWEGKVEKVGRRVHLIWPKAAESFNGSNNDLITLLFDAGWLETGGGGGKIQIIEGRSVAVVKPRVAQRISTIGCQSG